MVIKFLAGMVNDYIT